MTTQGMVQVENDLGRVIGGIQNLPTPPIVFNQIQKVLNNPNTSAYDIASILQEDPAISAKVLRMTNSAYYGLSRTIESVKQAVVIIGLEAVKNLVLSASMFEAFSSDQLDKEFQDVFWRHSLATAFAARLLGHALRSKQTFDPEVGFSGGLLHDVGKMVISVYMPEQAQRIKETKQQNPNSPDYRIEETILGYNHTQIGALLGDHWKLPARLIEAIKFHHFPGLKESEDNNLPYLIHLANHLAKYAFDYDPEDENSYIDPVEAGVINIVGTSEEELHQLAMRLREEYVKAETFMEMAKGG